MKPSQHTRQIFDNAPALAAHHNRVKGREIAEPKLARVFTGSHAKHDRNTGGLVNVGFLKNRAMMISSTAQSRLTAFSGSLAIGAPFRQSFTVAEIFGIAAFLVVSGRHSSQQAYTDARSFQRS